MIFRKILWIAVSAIIVIQVSIADAADLTLARDARTSYVIAVASDAIPAEKTAAEQLSFYLQKVTGAPFPVKSEDAIGSTDAVIYVGAGKKARQLLPGISWESFKTDTVVVETSGNSLILAGSRPRGALYAVYSFLEESIGVRWWTPTEEDIPARSTVNVAPLSLRYTPQFATRELLYGPLEHPAFAAKMKINGHWQKIGPELGGHNTILGFCHTFMELLPPETYFKTHPEWFTNKSNGGKPCTASSTMPAGHTWQICMSNEAARKEVTRNALIWLRKNRDATMISISQNDCDDRCSCDSCSALERSEGSPSGPLLRFVNQVAADIEKEFPNVLVETLAYNYTVKPPLHERPAHNVIIRLCSYGDRGRPIDSERNAAFRDELMRWKAIAPRLYVWHYLTNFANYLVPYPNWDQLGPDIRFLSENNAVALFAQGDARNEIGDMIPLRVWVLAHLMWNPNLNQRELEEEFLNGYFGQAAPAMGRYLAAVRKAGANAELHDNMKDIPYLNLEFMNEATQAFRDAQAAVAEQPLQLARVNKEMLVVNHAWILGYQQLRGGAAKLPADFMGPTDLAAFTQEFIRQARNAGIQSLNEAMGFNAYAERLAAPYTQAIALPPTIRVKPGKMVLDVQESSMLLYAQGKTTSVVDDPLASNQRAVKFVNNTFGWMIQYPLNLERREVISKKPWHCYVVVRIEPSPGKPRGTSAFVCGLYDQRAKKELAHLAQADDPKLDGKYNVFDLGVKTLNENCNFYLAGTNHANVNAFYLDRIIMVEAD